MNVRVSLERYTQIYENGGFGIEDIDIVINGKRFSCSFFALSVLSPKVSRLGSICSHPSTIVINEDIDIDCVEEFIKYIKGYQITVGVHNLIGLKTIAQCLYLPALSSHLVSIEYFMKKCSLEMNRLRSIESDPQTDLDFISMFFVIFASNDDFYNTKCQKLINILQNPCLRVPSEDVVLRFIILYEKNMMQFFNPEIFNTLKIQNLTKEGLSTFFSCIGSRININLLKDTFTKGYRPEPDEWRYVTVEDIEETIISLCSLQYFSLGAKNHTRISPSTSRKYAFYHRVECSVPPQIALKKKPKIFSFQI